MKINEVESQVGILVALVLRLKEIKGGEENEASKY